MAFGDVHDLGTGDTVSADRLDGATLDSGRRRPEPRDGDTLDSGVRGSAPLPRRVGRYHVLERLGAGGMGVVFTAYDPDLDRKVAIKLLHPGRNARETQVRLLREAQALARLSHPNVVQIHDAGSFGAQVFIAMEFVQGENLLTWLSAQERSVSDILRVFHDAGRGLAAAHAQGLVHRDFKPDNVLVGADGRARVADFGLARAGRDDAGGAFAPDLHQGPLDVSLTATGAILGTPIYMSPEQHAGGTVDARSDQFSFCVALWEALYRVRPFTGDSFAELGAAVISGAIRPPPADSKVPRRIADVLRRGLMPRPEQRHRDMPALLAALAHDPARARQRWFLLAVFFAMSVGTAFFVADRRAAEASACTGAAAELAGTWSSERRAGVAAALAGEPDTSQRVLAGLDHYAARWAAAHRDACLDHRRGELSPALFDGRLRCLDRRRLALGSAVTALGQRVPDAAQLVARLPGLAPCDDPDTILSEETWPEDPVLARTARDLDTRLIDARTQFHAGALSSARLAAVAVATAARAQGLRSLLAEALLLQGEILEAEFEYDQGRDAVAEAAVHAVATRRDDLAAEALARRIFFDAHNTDFDRALADEPLARAAAERLADPTEALARLDNNLGVLFMLQRDRDSARAYLERATAAIEHISAADPLESANYWGNLALAARDPAVRAEAFTRALTLLEGQLGGRHRRSLDLRLTRGMNAENDAAGADELAALCPRYPELYPDAPEFCAHCFVGLGHIQRALGRVDHALDAFRQVRSCRAAGQDQGDADHLASFGDRAAAFTALLTDRPADALPHADAALARNRPYSDRWWIAADNAELELVRALALHAAQRDDDARAALARAMPVLEDIHRTRGTLVDVHMLAEARALLTRLSPPP